MTRNLTNLFFTSIIILFLTIVSVAQAAPPAQEATQTGASFGETLDLDGVEEAATAGHNNLGRIMSSRNKGTASDEVEDDGTADDPDGSSDPDGDSGGDDTGDPDESGDANDDTDDNTGDEETGDDTNEEDANDDDDAGDSADEAVKQHPVAGAIAEFFGVDYDVIKGLHDQGYGFGVITKAYFFAGKLETPLTPEELLEEARVSGWGNVLKQNGIHPGSVGKGSGKWSKTTGTDSPDDPDGAFARDAGPPGQNKKHKQAGDQINGDSQQLAGPGRGQEPGIDSDGGKDKGQGHGNSAGNGKGNGKSNGGGKGKSGNNGRGKK